MLGATEMKVGVLLMAGLLLVSCGGEDTEADVLLADIQEVEEADVEPAYVDPLMIPAQILPSCPGADNKDTYPESYEEFCLEFVTQELLDTGNKCFYAVSQKEFGCFCKVCALQGAEINCISEQCN